MATVAEVESRLNALESRLAVNETKAGAAADKLDKQDSKNDSVSDRLATLEERVGHLPSKDFVVKTAIATVSAMLVLLGLQVAFWKAVSPPNGDRQNPSVTTKSKQ